MEGRHLILLALVAVGLSAGCRHAATPPFETWFSGAPAYSPTTNSDNAYDAYALAGAEVEAQAGSLLNRNYFTPYYKRLTLDKIGGTLARLEAATGRKCLFQFQPHQPGKPPRFQQGWRLLARALVWQIEQAVVDGDYGVAAKKAVAAITFGLDLTGGGALDASLGLSIVDDARSAIAPATSRMSPEQLAVIEDGITRALLNKPLLSQTFEHELQNMKAGVQYVQDAYRDSNWQSLLDLMGKDVRPAIEYLKQMKNKGEDKRVEFFRGLAGEADAEVAWLSEQSRLPAYKRSSDGPEDQEKERPWRRFAKHFFLVGRPLLSMDLRTVARTRLLLLEAHAMRAVKAQRSAPGDLSDVQSALRTDPYSGRDFIYRAQGADYRIYSVGADYRDDGGETDETYSFPDLMLEKR
jgi:hypothetical protein